MIGMIAPWPGIIVRNSILLVDFIELQVPRAWPLPTVIRSGPSEGPAHRAHGPGRHDRRLFILDDPIFNGLAISLIFGILVSTLLTLVVIPLFTLGGLTGTSTRQHRHFQSAFPIPLTGSPMTAERYIRIIAGTFILLSSPWVWKAALLRLILGPGLHGLRGRQLAAVRLHQLLPHGHHPAQAGREGRRELLRLNDAGLRGAGTTCRIRLSLQVQRHSPCEMSDADVLDARRGSQTQPTLAPQGGQAAGNHCGRHPVGRPPPDPSFLRWVRGA